MGAKDDALKNYFADSKVFADLFNGAYFHGKQVIDYRKLQKDDPVSNQIYRDEEDRLRTDERRRDLLRIVFDGERYLLALGVENQSKEDPYMPVRIMEYDARVYRQQIRQFELEEKERRAEAEKNSVCFQPRIFYLKPVITIVVYWETTPWKRATSLSEMFDPSLMEAYKDYGIQQLFKDYSINVCSICTLKKEQYNAFQTDLKLVPQIIHYTTDKKKLQELLEDGGMISDAAADVLEIFTEMRLKREECREGGQDVKTAFQEILEDAREEGREKGRREGAEWQLITLYKDNIIDYQTLVLRMNMSEAEVNKRLEEQTEE